MSYCRWSSGDVYMFAHVDGGIECCSCKFAKKVKTIFAKGVKDHPIFGDTEACQDCGGKGCDGCMIHGSMRLNSYDEALGHLQKHRDSGDEVPDHAFEGLKADRDSNSPLKPLLCACGETAMLFSFDGTPPKCLGCSLEEEQLESGELVLCPIKNVNIYKWVCLEKCSYHKQKKCPEEKKDE